MKKIICPTDFSPAANNAVEYAARLAQKLNVELELLNVQLLSAAEPVISGLKARESAVPTTEILEKMCIDVKNTFNISCNYGIETTSNTLQKAIGTQASENNMIVMGTNGTDDLYQYFFGTNTYHVVRKSKCPVLIIPEGITYKNIEKVVFAWDYSPDNKDSFFQLKELLKVYNPGITFLHISKEKTPIGDDVFRALKEDIHTYIGKSENIKFDRDYSENSESFPDKMDEYMQDSDADMLVITFYDRGKLKNIFHGTIARGLSESARYPLLVLHV